MRLPLHKSITTHSQYWHRGMCCYFYSLFITEFICFMYKIINKVTFIVDDIINAYIKKSIKLINTTSLSDNQSYRSVVATHIYYYVHFLCHSIYHTLYNKSRKKKQIFAKTLVRKFILNAIERVVIIFIYVGIEKNVKICYSN